MNAWDVWECDLGHGSHPVVIVSHLARAEGKEVVEVLDCSTQRTARPAFPNEVILDVEDGMNWKTFCKCDLIHAVFKSDLTNHRGHVTAEGRRRIVETINRSNGWV